MCGYSPKAALVPPTTNELASKGQSCTSDTVACEFIAKGRADMVWVTGFEYSIHSVKWKEVCRKFLKKGSVVAPF